MQELEGDRLNKATLWPFPLGTSPLCRKRGHNTLLLAPSDHFFSFYSPNVENKPTFLWCHQQKQKHFFSLAITNQIKKIYHRSERIPLPITCWCNKDETVSFTFINHLISVFRGLNAELLINLRRHSHFSLLRHMHASCVFLYFCAVEVLYCSHLWKDNWVLSSWGRAWLETWQSKWREEPACLFTSPSSSAWTAYLEQQTMLGPTAKDRCCSSLGPTLAGRWRILDGS